MIQFRCWYCRRRFGKPESRVGERFDCGGCQRPNRVPRRSGGNSRVRSPTDWAVEVVLCGGGGAVLGFFLALMILSRMHFLLPVPPTWLTAALVLAGFLAGTFGGVPGLNWIGRKIRDREQGD